MLALSLALLGQAAALPPADWSGLPPLQLRRPADIGTDLSAFVAGEVRDGRCTPPTAHPGSLKVDLAVLGTPDGSVERVVPRAISCPTVEQYAAGVMLRMARDNVDAHGTAAPTWYHTSLTFSWRP